MKTLVSVSFDDTNNNYTVEIPQGSSMEETAFCVSVIAKCFVKTNVIENHTQFLELVEKYCTDPQYDELKEGENNGET